MRYRHFRNEEGHPVATLASTKTNEETILLALSRCNTSVDTFHKLYGREIASRRLQTQRHLSRYETVTHDLVRHLLLGNPATLPKEQMPDLIEELKETFSTPKRAVQLACT